MSSVKLFSHVQLFVTPWMAAGQASLSIANSPNSLKLMSIESVMPSNHLILCQPLFLLPSFFPSIRVFSSESVLCIRSTKYWSFSFSISASNEYLRLISFRMDWLDLLAVQGTLKSLFQHNNSKTSILCYSAFLKVQLLHPLEKETATHSSILAWRTHGWRNLIGYSPWGCKESDMTEWFHFHFHLHPYMTTGKTIALTRWTFASKVMSLIFNMLSSLVIAFLPRSKCLLISRLQSPSAVILEPQKIKSATVSTVSPSICHEVMGMPWF